MSRVFQGSLFLMSYTPGEHYLLGKEGKEREKKGKGRTQCLSAFYTQEEELWHTITTLVSAVTLSSAAWVCASSVVLLLPS